MENAATLSASFVKEKADYLTGLDTKLVVLFLAMDTGRGFSAWDLNEFLSFFTIGILVVLPYFLPVPAEKPEFAGWVLWRVFIGGIGFILGAGLNVISQVFLMESIKYLPMTFLILTGILCAATQIRGIIGVRLAS